MPTALWGKLISFHLAHSAIASGHPGTQWTYHLLWDKYWWPNILRYIQCLSHHKPRSRKTLAAGKLMPLPLDFISDLPESVSTTVIFVIKDQFSKTMHLIYSLTMCYVISESRKTLSVTEALRSLHVSS